MNASPIFVTIFHAISHVAQAQRNANSGWYHLHRAGAHQYLFGACYLVEFAGGKPRWAPHNSTEKGLGVK